MIELSIDFTKWIEEVLAKENMSLYHIDQEIHGANTHLIIYIKKNNKEESIDLDDCVLITQIINEKIDDYIDEEYILEISSPGINRQLFTKEHYQEVIGQEIEIRLKSKVEGLNTKKEIGTLEEVNEEYILFNNIKVEYNKIKKANCREEKND